MNFKEFQTRYQLQVVEENLNEVPRKPLVSVCVQTYQHVHYIKECLEGILLQKTDFEFEILLGEDGSNDGTREICLKYAKRYSKKIRLFLHHRNNNIRIANKPTGRFNFSYNLYSARGKYIAFCEGDDYWTDPYKLQKQVNFLETNPDYVLTFSKAQPFNEQGNINKNFGGTVRDLDSIELQKAPPINTLTACFHNVFEEVPEAFFKAPIGDLFLWSILGKYGKGKFLENIDPARYRVHDGGVFSNKSKKVKGQMAVVTLITLASHYIKIKNMKLAFYFLKRAIIRKAKNRLA